MHHKNVLIVDAFTKMSRLLLLCIVGISAGCNPIKQSDTVSDNDEQCINFTDSVIIIRSLLRSNALVKILEGHDPEKLDFLINNFSPAEIAFESEVLSCTDPVVIYVYQQCIDQSLFAKLKAKYRAHKIVTIDADKFPVIVESLMIDIYPTIIEMNQRVEIDRLAQNQLTLQ